MTDNLKTGKPDIEQDAPAHVKGVNEGNAVGNYEKMKGHKPDGRATARRSTGINPDLHDPIDPRMPNLSPG